jgi:hypothetical protein
MIEESFCGQYGTASFKGTVIQGYGSTPIADGRAKNILQENLPTATRACVFLKLVIYFPRIEVQFRFGKMLNVIH